MGHNYDIRPKLNGAQKQLLIQMLADFASNKDILAYFNDEYKISLSSGTITHYRKTKEKEIIEIRKMLGDRMLAIPLANKFKRIELREQLIRDILAHTTKGSDKVESRLWHTIKNKYGSYKKGNHGAVNDLLDSIKAELEPKKFAMTDPEGNSLENGVIILPAVKYPDGKGPKGEKDGKSRK